MMKSDDDQRSARLQVFKAENTSSYSQQDMHILNKWNLAIISPQTNGPSKLFANPIFIRFYQESQTDTKRDSV